MIYKVLCHTFLVTILFLFIVMTEGINATEKDENDESAWIIIFHTDIEPAAVLEQPLVAVLKRTTLADAHTCECGKVKGHDGECGTTKAIKKVGYLRKEQMEESTPKEKPLIKIYNCCPFHIQNPNHYRRVPCAYVKE